MFSLLRSRYSFFDRVRETFPAWKKLVNFSECLTLSNQYATNLPIFSITLTDTFSTFLWPHFEQWYTVRWQGYWSIHSFRSQLRLILCLLIYPLARFRFKRESPHAQRRGDTCIDWDFCTNVAFHLLSTLACEGPVSAWRVSILQLNDDWFLLFQNIENISVE